MDYREFNIFVTTLLLGKRRTDFLYQNYRIMTRLEITTRESIKKDFI
jgi:hypothetical protein